jgi:hypothetical protein
MRGTVCDGSKRPGARAHGGLRREDRQGFALCLAAVWLVGFELIPAAHLGAHGQLGPHDHGVPGARAADHCHGEACHAHGPDARSDAAPDPDHGPALTGSGSRPHGAGSLEHRDTAAQPVPPAVPPVLEARAILAPAPAPWRSRAPEGHGAPARARGPPVFAIG